jgi:PAS domain S-box-containing protein
MKYREDQGNPLLAETVKLRRRVAELEKAKIEAKYAGAEWSFVLEVLNSLVNGVVITNIDGRITYVNPAFLGMFKYEKKREVFGKDAAELFTREQIRQFSHVESIIDETEGETKELIVRCKDDSIFSAEVSYSDISDDRGNVIGRMASFIDTTKLNRARSEPR